jgi:K+-transporting ATPase ATPase C chain
VECRKPGPEGDAYSIGQIVPIRGSAPADPQVPADAVTASGSGLDPDISVAYADAQVNRVAKARSVTPDEVRQAVRDNEDGRWLGFFGEPTVNVVTLNLELDQKYPVKS